jgi:deazaflavin-dependent oxidoreductase (nitroreductase family)
MRHLLRPEASGYGSVDGAGRPFGTGSGILPDAREGVVANRNQGIIDEFRANEGRVGGYFEGATMLILHTTGRRSGNEHVTPAVYLPDGDRWVVVGSKGGAPDDPDWVRNLEANPEATIEVGAETIRVRATKILREGPEWEDLYARHVERRRGFADYLVKTQGIRRIPVIVLERRST